MNTTDQHLSHMRRESVIMDLLVTILRNQHYNDYIPGGEKIEQEETLMRASVEEQTLEDEIKAMLKTLQ